MASTSTMAKPEKIAPATKYGGKIVECHPGRMAIVKSKLTTVWTDNTRGVASPASSFDAVRCHRQCRDAPRQPSASTPYTAYSNRLFARSRTDAKSGIRPRYQNSSDTVAYVETAKTSQTSGLRNCGCTVIVFGYGRIQ